jgi:metal-dependent amidase/aminoacylase/carboxypeptidase family protein
MPHLARNPIPAAAALVGALPAWLDRTFGAFDPVVATVTGLTGGGAENIIPDVATVRAAVRSFSPEAAATLAERLPAFCADTAQAHGCTADVDWDVRYPFLENDAGETAFALDVARSLAGGDQVEELAAPLAASEDFARVLQELPGCYLLLGARPPELAVEDAAHHHAPEVVFDDAVLSDGATLLAALAAERIARA